MGYKLIALDIDGTIRSNEHPVTDRTREAIAAAMDAGATVTLATGRIYRSARRAAAELNIASPIVSFQGAHVADPVADEVLWHRPLTPDLARAALDSLVDWDLEVAAYFGDLVYVGEMTPWAEAYGVRNQIEVIAVGDLRNVASSELTRLVAVGAEGEIQRLEASMHAEFDSSLYVTRSLPHLCEILHPDGGKDRALAWLCERRGIRREETVAFGNGYNDVRMLDWAGLSVAVGGGVPEAVGIADRVAPPMEEDGAARVLYDLLNSGLIG